MTSKAVFVDRDDTLAKNVPYCDDPDKFHLFPGVPQAVKRLNDAGYLVIVITNQSGIGRGYFDEATLQSVHDKLKRDVESGGGHIDDIFYCPHTPSDGCGCRKPEIGMGTAAVAKYDIDVSKSYMVGDSNADMGFGKKLGCRKCYRVSKEYTFCDAVDDILRRRGHFLGSIATFFR